MVKAKKGKKATAKGTKAKTKQQKKTEASKNTGKIANIERLIINQIPTPIFAVDQDFNILSLNAEAYRWQGKEVEDLIGFKCFDLFRTDICQTADCPIRLATEKNVICTGQTKANREGEVVSIEFTSNVLKDERGRIVGGVEYIVDISERLEAEAKSLQLQKDIMELSTPVLTLWKDILGVPLIGTLDSRRTQDVMEKALTRMSENRARVLIVDITGVPVIDTMVANHLIRMATAVTLMGGDCIMTGISPATARTIVHLGIDLSAIKTRASLDQGLELAIDIVKKGRGE